MDETHRDQVITQNILKIAEVLRLGDGELAKIIGVGSTQVAAFRAGTEACDTRSEVGVRAAHFIKIAAHLSQTLESDEAMGEWLHSADIGLGKAPLDLMVDKEGVKAVHAFVEASRKAG